MLEKLDKRVANAAKLAGYPITDSGLVVCEGAHIGTKSGPELSRSIDRIAQDYAFIFLDMLNVETMTRSFADRLAKKEHYLAMQKHRRLVLVDPSKNLDDVIWQGRRDNGLSPGMETLFTINPTPRTRLVE